MRKEQQQQKITNAFVAECLKGRPSTCFIFNLLRRGADPNTVFSLRPLTQAEEGRLLTSLSALLPNGIILLEFFLRKGLVISETDTVALRVLCGPKSKRFGLSTAAWLDRLFALNAKYPDKLSLGFLSRLELRLSSRRPTSKLERIVSVGGNFSSILWKDLDDARMEHLDRIISFSSGQEVGKRFVFEQPGTSWEKVNEIIRTICQNSPATYEGYGGRYRLSDQTIPFLTKLRAHQPNMVFDVESVHYFVRLCVSPSDKNHPKIARSTRVELIEWILESLKRYDNGRSLCLRELFNAAPLGKRRYDLYRAWSRSDLVGSWALKNEIDIVMNIYYVPYPYHDSSRKKPYELTEEERLFETFNNPFSRAHYTTVFYAPHHYMFLVPFQKRIIRTVLMIRSFGSSILSLVPNEILFEIFSFLFIDIYGPASRSVSVERHPMFDTTLALLGGLGNVYRYSA